MTTRAVLATLGVTTALLLILGSGGTGYAWPDLRPGDEVLVPVRQVPRLRTSLPDDAEALLRVKALHGSVLVGDLVGNRQGAKLTRYPPLLVLEDLSVERSRIVDRLDRIERT